MSPAAISRRACDYGHEKVTPPRVGIERPIHLDHGPEDNSALFRCQFQRALHHIRHARTRSTTRFPAFVFQHDTANPCRLA